MADNTDREGGQTMFDMIRGPDDDQNEEDYDGSEFLNNTGEGDMIFDRDDRVDEVMNYDYDDDEEHVDPETTCHIPSFRHCSRLASCVNHV